MKLPDFDIDRRLFPAPPLWLVATLVIGAFLPMTAGAAIWYKRNKMTPEPRYHIFQDMDASVALKAQESSVVFEDGRAARPYAPGTVGWGRSANQPDPGMLKDDDLGYRGFAIDPETGEKVLVGAGDAAQPQFLEGFPAIVNVNHRFLERGQQMYNTFCFPCHGRDGQGAGPVHDRANQLVNQVGNPTATNWVPPKDLTLAMYGPAQYPNGQLFNTITDGAGNMAAYGHQISVEDRWAIVAYLRALQLTDQGGEPATAGVPHDHDGDGTPDH